MDNMTFKELLEQMRASLTPFNPEWVNRSDYDIVKMGIHSNYGYMEGKTIREAIDFFEKRSLTAFALNEQLNPLEALGAILLLESAYLRDAAR
jgi:hypothetical protein